MEDQSEQTTDNPTVEDAAPKVEEQSPVEDNPSRPLADRISDIRSKQDVKDIIDDGLDRLKGVTVDDAVESTKSLVTRLVGRVASGFDEATRKD